MAYKTEQKTLLLQFLARHSGEAFTIDELAEKIAAESDKAPGKSTLYRLMPQLIEEGKVKRFNEGHSRHFRYQMIESDHCHDHLHLRCSGCGKLYHMEDKESAEIVRGILARHHFAVDGADTVLLGRCEDCLAGKETE